MTDKDEAADHGPTAVGGARSTGHDAFIVETMDNDLMQVFAECGVTSDIVEAICHYAKAARHSHFFNIDDHVLRAELMAPPPPHSAAEGEERGEENEDEDEESDDDGDDNEDDDFAELFPNDDDDDFMNDDDDFDDNDDDDDDVIARR